MSNLSVVHLKCPNCGASLTVGAGMDALSCEYCGARSRVQRSGGEASLHALADVVAKLQRGADKSAAELAIKRLTEELEAAQERARQHAREAQSRLADLENQRARISARVLRDALVGLILGVASLTVSIFCAALIHMRFEPGTEPIAMGWLISYWSGAVLIGVVVFLAWWRRCSRKRARLLEHKARESFAAKSELEATGRRLEEAVRSLKARLQDNRNIADS